LTAAVFSVNLQAEVPNGFNLQRKPAMQTSVTLAAVLMLIPLPPQAGARVADFTLKDIDGHPVSLAGFKDKKAIVIVFVGTECPLANLYLPTLARMHRTFAAQGVQVLAINSNDQDSAADVAAHARERKLPFPMLKDLDHRAADALGARRTPEAFLLDPQRIIRYHGRIDDQYGYAYRRAAPSQTELKDAIKDVLAGRPVATPFREVQGCVIGRGKDGTSHLSK
jgi:peroxiredoxin